MIDLDVALAASEEKRGAKAWFECGNLSYCDINELITRLRQAEKDAARYRWLRDESVFTHNNAPLTFFTDTNGDQIAFDFNGSSYSVLYDEMLDAAIDEAMQCK